MLRIAIERMRSGDHRKAIQQLETTLAKDPSSAAYVQGLLGYEYMRTDQVSAALPCFERAVLLVPHEPTNHHNFAVALAVDGNYGRAEQEALRAHDLAPDNPDIERFLEFLRAAKGSRSGTQLDAQSRPN